MKNILRETVNMKISKLALFATLSVMVGSASAATDGTMGATSTGTSGVTLIKESTVQITGIADLDLGTAGFLTVDASTSDDVCVFSSSGSYSVTVTSTNGSFILADVGTATDIAYDLNWTVAATPQALTYSAASTAVAGNQSDPTCGGTPNANFEVVVPTAGFNAAEPGTYIDTLTLIISPE